MDTEAKATTQIEAKAKSELEKAILNRTPCEFFINRYGEQETLDVGRNPDPELDLDDAERLGEEFALYAPTFGVCCALKGELLGTDGNPVSFDDLPRLIEEAEDERVRFYSEREKEFGPSAWPGGRAS
jgi:hypothetical protein